MLNHSPIILSLPGSSSGPAHSVSVLSRVMRHCGHSSDSAGGTGDVYLQPGWGE